MTARFLWVAFYTLLGLALLAFMAMNRATVAVRLPFMEPWEMPLFMALTTMFIGGLLLGLSFAAIQWMTLVHRNRRQARAMAQLEKEIESKNG